MCGKYKQHPKFWYSDGSIVVRVDDETVFRIHKSMLEKLSDDMRSILAIPDGKDPRDPTREGSGAYPLHIQGIAVIEWTDFLQWMYRAEWESLGKSDEERERICTSLLKLADKWNIEPAKKCAIENLQTMNLRPARLVQLAGMFDIPDWVGPAVTKILEDKVTTLSTDDTSALGLRVYTMLVKAQSLLEVETRRIAFVPPAIAKDPSWQCKNHASCRATWPKVWFEKIGKRLLHAANPLQLKDIKMEVLRQSFGLSDFCELDVQALVVGTTFPHEQIIPACAARIVEYHKSL
ncbi:hypothetical protein B0H16DRAFT_1311261 [Mycena metata]|uniref:BTB domain-containing protein n=1 Tax=Mycena metata TaxID=1033252 RepID=A0AAD7JEV0_9AGAR|nr:hypothetical protein B0H16DRAFT_1334510 [Mycena metata]KAJ7763425.1 hypothetical protein B0H16DRAFT_1311261 [Mycena metata]